MEKDVGNPDKEAQCFLYSALDDRGQDEDGRTGGREDERGEGESEAQRHVSERATSAKARRSACSCSSRPPTTRKTAKENQSTETVVRLTVRERERERGAFPSRFVCLISANSLFDSLSIFLKDLFCSS